MVRFCLIRETTNTEILVEYSKAQFMERIQARVKENLASYKKKKWDSKEIAIAIDKAGRGLFREYEEKEIVK